MACPNKTLTIVDLDTLLESAIEAELDDRRSKLDRYKNDFVKPNPLLDVAERE